jgi:citrate synthase
MTNTTPAFAAGLEGVIACRTRLSDVDGINGKLVFSGYNAVELATTKTFEEVWFLLHHGRLPSCAEHAEFREKLEALGTPTRQEIDLMKRLRKGNTPLSAFRSIISAIAVHRNYQPWLNREPAEAAQEVIALAALAPAIVEVIHTGRTPVKKKGNRGYADRYLWGVLGRRPEQTAMEAVQTYLILTMDHGMNASTFASRVTASTGADVGAALTSGIGTLSGPLHGGAPGPVLDMLDGIGTVENAANWVAGEMAAGRRIMGFGHRVYRTDDPRSMTLRGVAERLKSPRVELARAVETEVLAALAAHQQKKAAAGKPVRALRVNVEFWTAVVLEHVGIPRELFSSTFCTSRIAGWSEHIIEAQRQQALPPVVPVLGAGSEVAPQVVREGVGAIRPLLLWLRLLKRIVVKYGRVRSRNKRNHRRAMPRERRPALSTLRKKLDSGLQLVIARFALLRVGIQLHFDVRLYSITLILRVAEPDSVGCVIAKCGHLQPTSFGHSVPGCLPNAFPEGLFAHDGGGPIILQRCRQYLRGRC